MENDISPSVEELREYIKEGYCWVCNTGGWKRLPKHTSARHGIYADDIREMAFLIKETPVCTKEESLIISERTNRLLREGKRKLPDRNLANLVKHTFCEAGKKAQRDKAVFMRTHLTKEIRNKTTEKLRDSLCKPHPCPVCGKMISHSSPICCSPKCAKERIKDGGRIGGNRLWNKPECRRKMIEILNNVREKPKPHPCPTCGKIIPRSRPKYCSLQCSKNKNTPKSPVFAP